MSWSVDNIADERQTTLPARAGIEEDILAAVGAAKVAVAFVRQTSHVRKKNRKKEALKLTSEEAVS